MRLDEMKQNKLYSWFLINIAASLICIIYMHYIVLSDKSDLVPYSYFENVCFAIIDVCLFYLPFVFLSKKYKVILFIPLFLTEIYCIANILYSRYFFTYIPIDLYTEIGNLDGLSSNILEAIEIKDSIFIIATFIPVYIYIRNKKSINKANYSAIKINKTISLIVISLILIMLAQALYTWRLGGLKNKYIRQFDYSPTESTFKYGIFFSTITQSLQTNKEKFSLNELEKLETYFYGPTNVVTKPQKNIILIIVESLLSYATEIKIDSLMVTPNLDNLIKEEGTYYNTKMISQETLGESSDGQLMYLTGLLPKKQEVTIIKYFDNKFISTAELLQKRKTDLSTLMIIPTGTKMWRQDGMCINYHIENLYSRKDYSSSSYTEQWLNDKVLFQFAESIVSKTKEPFFKIILTSSTHSPYTTIHEKWNIKFPEKFSNELKIYLTNVHYMDKYLGKYLSWLKEKGIYNNSTIIIMSDHKAPMDRLNTNEIKNAYLPLYIINPPQEIKYPTDKEIMQIDVFPTILDLMGIKSKWRGVGTSLLTSDSIRNTEYEKFRRQNMQKISDIILNSDYFKNHNYQ